MKKDPVVVAILREVINECAIGDIDENSDHPTWAWIVKESKRYVGESELASVCTRCRGLLGQERR